MKNLAGSLSFLANLGIFSRAEHLISDLSLHELQNSYEHLLKQNELEQASLVAQKISVKYGEIGLMLYFNIQLILLKNRLEAKEQIDQDIIFTLGLVLFVEENTRNKPSKDIVDDLKSKLLSMCNQRNKEEIFSEAIHQFKYYQSL